MKDVIGNIKKKNDNVNHITIRQHLSRFLFIFHIFLSSHVFYFGFIHVFPVSCHVTSCSQLFVISCFHWFIVLLSYYYFCSHQFKLICLRGAFTQYTLQLKTEKFLCVLAIHLHNSGILGGMKTQTCKCKSKTLANSLLLTIGPAHWHSVNQWLDT